MLLKGDAKRIAPTFFVCSNFYIQIFVFLLNLAKYTRFKLLRKPWSAFIYRVLVEGMAVCNFMVRYALSKHAYFHSTYQQCEPHSFLKALPLWVLKHIWNVYWKEVKKYSTNVSIYLGEFSNFVDIDLPTPCRFSTQKIRNCNGILRSFYQTNSFCNCHFSW